MSFGETLEEILGHEKEIVALVKIGMEAQGSGAFLFFGPDGIGKKSVAMAFSRQLLCVSGSGVVPCGACESCRIPLSRHPDFRSLDSGEELSIGIDQARDFARSSLERPLLSSIRIGLVDEAHRLTRGAANSLLRIVEEPPGGTFFFFVTASPESLPPPLLSRLMRIRFKPLSEPVLERIATSLFPDHPGEDLVDAIRLSGGSVARLANLLKAPIRELEEKIRLFLEGCIPGQGSGHKAIAGSWSALSEKEGFDHFLEALEWLLLSSERHLGGFPEDPSWAKSSLPREVAGGISDFRRGGLHDRIGETRRAFVYNINRGLALEQFLWDLETSFSSRSL